MYEIIPNQDKLSEPFYKDPREDERVRRELEPELIKQAEQRARSVLESMTHHVD
jgi:hypothetical protein